MVEGFHVLFYHKPECEMRAGKNVWKKLEKILERENAQYQAYITEKPVDAKVFARKLTEGCREPHVIVAVGGDGTVNEILDGLSFCSPVTLGYIPAGSGNDLARSLKVAKKAGTLSEEDSVSKYP